MSLSPRCKALLRSKPPRKLPKRILAVVFPTERERPAVRVTNGTPCSTCSVAVNLADELGIELDKRDVEQEVPYQELLALGGDANKIPYLYVGGELIEGQEAVLAKLEAMK